MISHIAMKKSSMMDIICNRISKDVFDNVLMEYIRDDKVIDFKKKLTFACNVYSYDIDEETDEIIYGKLESKKNTIDLTPINTYEIINELNNILYI